MLCAIKRFFSYLFVGILGAVIGAGAYQLYMSGIYVDSSFKIFEPLRKKPLIVTHDDSSKSFSRIVGIARPSVVHVRVTHKPDFFEWGIDDIVRDLDSWFGQLDDSLRTHAKRTQGIHSFYDGSGVVVSPDGYILTLAYLLYGAEKVQVTTCDHKVYDAQVVGIDRNSGLALIKISPISKLHTIDVANMRSVAVNQWVVSLGYDDAVSHGVIRSYMPQHFMLTDAMLIPKTVGGVLLNMNGEFLGINTSHIDFSSNFSFVIPADYAMRISTSLKQKGFVEPTYLGVVAQDLTSNIASSFKLKPKSCVLVSQVMAGSPALQAGVKSGDCISAFENHDITSVAELYSLVSEHDASRSAVLSIRRNGSVKKLTIKWEQTSISNEVPPFRFYPEMGMAVREMLPEELKNYNTKSGLLVGHMDSSGSAHSVGLRSGDILVAMNGKVLNHLSQFDDMIRSPSKSAAFLMQRASDRAFVAVEKVEPKVKSARADGKNLAK